MHTQIHKSLASVNGYLFRIRDWRIKIIILWGTRVLRHNRRLWVQEYLFMRLIILNRHVRLSIKILMITSGVPLALFYNRYTFLLFNFNSLHLLDQTSQHLIIFNSDLSICAPTFNHVLLFISPVCARPLIEISAI